MSGRLQDSVGDLSQDPVLFAEGSENKGILAMRNSLSKWRFKWTCHLEMWSCPLPYLIPGGCWEWTPGTYYCFNDAQIRDKTQNQQHWRSDTSIGSAHRSTMMLVQFIPFIFLETNSLASSRWNMLDFEADPDVSIEIKCVASWEWSPAESSSPDWDPRIIVMWPQRVSA